jgi:hypothetical protein
LEVWDELPELNEWERLYFERHIRRMAEQDENITVRLGDLAKRYQHQAKLRESHARLSQHMQEIRPGDHVLLRKPPVKQLNASPQDNASYRGVNKTWNS